MASRAGMGMAGKPRIPKSKLDTTVYPKKKKKKSPMSKLASLGGGMTGKGMGAAKKPKKSMY